MPLQKARWTGSEWAVFQGMDVGAPPDDDFVSGETMPFYNITQDFTGSKNIGIPLGTPLVPYELSVIGGVTQIPAGTYNYIDFGNTILDIRGNATFNYCRGILTSNTNYTYGEQVRILNGSSTGLVVFNNCEFHNRAQRIINGINGRNFIVNKCILTGHVDAVNNSPSGSAPNNSPGEVNDSWLGDQAWWRYSSTGVVHPSDTQTHNDASQTAMPNMKWNNCFFGVWPSEYVGTGTPNSGSETNPHAGQTYIVSQATQNQWRNDYLNRYTRADQSFQGVSRRTSTGGSWAGIMGTLSGGGALGFEVDHCWFSGGTVAINYSNTNLTGNAGFIKRCTFWNDMSGGHSLTSTAKGTAVYVKSGLTLDMPTTGPDRNLWFDGTTVTPATA